MEGLNYFQNRLDQLACTFKFLVFDSKYKKARFSKVFQSIGILKKINIRLFHDYSTITKHKACGSLCSPNNIDSNTSSWRFFNLLYTPEVYVTFIFNLLKFKMLSDQLNKNYIIMNLNSFLYHSMIHLQYESYFKCKSLTYNIITTTMHDEFK